MRKLLVLLLFGVFVVGSSCAATLRVHGTAPNQLNDGSCTTPVLSVATSPQVIHAQVVGRGLEDSLTTLPGTPFAFSWTLPPGTYQVRAWASLSGSPWLVGCDTTITVNAAAPPWRVGIIP